MKVRRTLKALAQLIADEAEHNPVFNQRLQNILGIPCEEAKPASSNQGDEVAAPATNASSSAATPKRPSNRRPPAVLDPIHLARQGEDVLRTELSRLDIEKLRDIVADYGMDTGKIVMKWRSTDRIIDRIVEVALLRSQKGSAFRDQSEEQLASDQGSIEGNTTESHSK